MRKHVSENGIPYPVLYDKNRKNLKTVGIKAYPVAFLLDVQGKVIWEGFLNKSKFATIEKLLQHQLARSGK